MKKVLLAVFLAATSFNSSAFSCIRGPLYSEHKALHFGGTALISSVVTYETKNPYYGISAGMAAGFVREIYKINTPGMRCEWSSMTYDLAGALVGAYVGQNIVFTKTKDGYHVSWSKNF